MIYFLVKNKYGKNAVLSEESSSSEDDDDKVIFTEEFERDFFKTLSCLKKKDPRIYDQNVRFFEKESVANGAAEPKKKSDKEKPITIRDYNRKIILEKDGKFSDDDGNIFLEHFILWYFNKYRANSLTYLTVGN